MLPRDSAVALKRRQDYRPPAFLVDTLDLTLDLAAEATEVTASLAFRRNAHADAARRAAPLVLDGEQQEDVASSSTAPRCARRDAQLPPRSLTILGPPDEHAHRSLADRARAQRGTRRPVRVVGRVLHAVRGRRVPPHHLFPRPPGRLARYTVTLRADRTRVPGPAVERQPGRAGSLAGRASLRDLADPFPKPSYLFAPSQARSMALEDTFVTRSGRTSRCAIYSTRPTSRAAGTRWRR